ncbi:MAG: polysaccharide deacetylase family protein [Candidatus Freyrarchaeum guaymaensis]
MEINVAITIDLDRDCPMPVKGVKHAVSDILIGNPNRRTDAVFSCTVKGLEKTLELLKDLEAKATFFIEARTLLYLKEHRKELVKSLSKNEVCCHGLNHEDLTGEETGVRIEYRQQLAILKKATQTIERLLNVKPRGFRAPYLKTNADTIKALTKLGYLYDSSIMVETVKPPLPYIIRESQSGLIEVPVPVYLKKPRKMALYTWALFEKRRKIDEYKKVLRVYQKNDSGGLLQVSFHPWHLAYLIREKRNLSEEEIEENVNTLKELLTQIVEDNNEMFTVWEYLKSKYNVDSVNSGCEKLAPLQE